jgi:molybdopterin synthase catalytic subunit
VTFLGLVRNHNVGRRVRYLEYDAYEPLAQKTFERIASEVRDRWPGAQLALHHRVGRLEIGEASVAIARIACA